MPRRIRARKLTNRLPHSSQKSLSICSAKFMSSFVFIEPPQNQVADRSVSLAWEDTWEILGFPDDAQTPAQLDAEESENE